MNEIAVHRQLASLATSVDHLTETMKALSSQWARQEEVAVAGRSALHKKFEDFRVDVGVKLTALGARIDNVAKTVSKVEPAVKKYEDEKLREEGAKRLGKGLIAAITAAAGVIGWGANELLAWLKLHH